MTTTTKSLEDEGRDGKEEEEELLSY